MRLILAGLFVFGSALVVVAILGATGLLDRGGIFALLPAATLLLSIPLALWLFSPRHSNVFGLKSPEEHLRELEEAGLLVDSAFEAFRAFGVSEAEDEGLHYYLELSDGGVLFLSGQYLYDYEPISDDPELNQPRQFPCSRFTVRRHRTDGYVVQLVCDGEILEPEIEAPAFAMAEWRADAVPSDGDVISQESYEAIKARRLAARS